MHDTLLEMRNVTKSFPGVLALNNVNIELKKGEILGICGENGAGKSTLMKVLSGSYASSDFNGDIFTEGERVDRWDIAAAQKFGIEMVYQEMNMILDISIAENMFVGKLPGKQTWVNFRELYRRANEALKEVNLDLDPRINVRRLNSGQMQLISLMRALVKNPRILVLDEPTSALTNSEVDTLMNVLEKLGKKDVSCIYISHKLDEIYRICDRVVVLRDGSVINKHDVNTIDQDTLIEEMVGRKLENLYPRERHKIEKEILRVEHLTIPHPNIQGRNIVDDVSFSLRKGEILGIGGLVGSGRSEALGGIFGQLTKGVEKKVFIDGEEVKIESPEDAIKNGIGYLTEERKQNGIIWMLSIRENMVLPSIPDIPGKYFVNRDIEKSLTNEMITRLRIKTPSIETMMVKLSGGNQQKVILGKWMMKKPKILFMDEPTRGIDVGTKASFYKMMGELVKTGLSIVMVSSDMPELVSMSDRCLVLCDGKITAVLEKEEISETSILRNCIRRKKEELNENNQI